MARSYQVCTHCIVDTTDPDIHFDEQGVCNHCYEYDRIAQERVFAGERGRQELECIVSQIKAEGQHKEYDCVIGVSGGVDSTFVAYTVKKLGLRPLAVHVDNGWDSELAVSNIEKFLKRLGIDLYTHVLDWEEFKDLQLSFLKASVPDAEVPTDHAIVAVLFQVTAERGIRYLLPGGNHATEGILPIRWAYGGSDWRYIKSIQQQFGTAALKTFPHFSLFDMFRYVFVNRARSIRILNYVPYNKSQAMQTLENELDWKYYGGKHYESIYTRFFQGYILPRKFNIDKRKAHLSSLICAGQMTRAEAIDTMRHNPYTEEMQQADREYVVKKLDLTDEGFEQIMQLPVKSFYDYPTYYPFLNRIRRWVSAAKQWGLLPRQNAAW